LCPYSNTGCLCLSGKSAWLELRFHFLAGFPSGNSIQRCARACLARPISLFLTFDKRTFCLNFKGSTLEIPSPIRQKLRPHSPGNDGNGSMPHSLLRDCHAKLPQGSLVLHRAPAKKNIGSGCRGLVSKGALLLDLPAVAEGIGNEANSLETAYENRTWLPGRFDFKSLW